MQCRDCGTTILESLGKRNGERCKPCAQEAKGLPPDQSDFVEAAPVPQSLPAVVPRQYPPPPEGYRYIYNRTAEVYEPFFDGSPVVFQPHEVRMLQSAIAEVLRNTSLIRGTLRNMGGGILKAERALALGPGWVVSDSHKLQDDTWAFDYAPAEAEGDFLVPSTTAPGDELFDPTSVPNYLGMPSRENLPTTRKAIRV